MAEAAGKEEATPGALKEKAEESEGEVSRDIFCFHALISKGSHFFMLHGGTRPIYTYL